MLRRYDARPERRIERRPECGVALRSDVRRQDARQPRPDTSPSAKLPKISNNPGFFSPSAGIPSEKTERKKGGGRCNGILSSVRAGLVSRCKIRAVRAINPYPDYGSAYQFYTFRASPMPDSKEPAPKRTNRLLPTQPRAPDWQPPPSVWRFRRGRPENSPSHSPAPRRTRRHRARPSGG